jgi:tetratricopeptide (TPR) repeat protein
MKDPQNFTLQGTLAETIASNAEKNRGSQFLDYLIWPGRIALLLAILLSPWALGSVRPWAQQWIAIAMLVGLGFWWFETSLNQRNKQYFPYVFFPVFLGLIIGLLQLWELPSWLASMALGRQVDIFKEFAADLRLSPTISVSHAGTKKFLSILALGVAALLLGSRYFKTTFEVKLLLILMTVNGVLLSIFGIVQKFTSDLSHIYWVIELDAGNPFGPYVNRNNGAGYLLICLACAIGLVIILMGKKEDRGPRPIISKEIPFWRQLVFHFQLFISDLTPAKVVSILAVGIIGVGVLATLSRGGIAAMLIASFVTLMLYGMARKPTFTGFILLSMIFLAFGVAGWIGFSDALASRFENVELVEVDQNGRVSHWQDTLSAVNEFGLLGSGIGSYEGAHRMFRTTPEKAVFKYAESQFVQTALEMGWFGLVLLVGCWLLVFYYGAFALWRGSSPVTIGIGVAGVFLATATPIASAFDFGIYQPSNMIAVAALSGFLAYQAQSLAGRLKDKTLLRFETSNWFVQTIALLVFAMVVVSWLNLMRRASIDNRTYLSSDKFTYQNPDQKTAKKWINELTPLLRQSPDDKGLVYLADLFIHLSRIQYYNSTVSSLAENAKMKSDQDRDTFLNNIWKLTALEYMQENIYSLKRETSQLEANLFRQQDFIRNNIPSAIQALQLSRRSNLLQPFVYVRLARLYAIAGDPALANRHMDQAVMISPSNVRLRFAAAVHYLQSGDQAKAAENTVRYLEMNPRGYRAIEKILSGNSTRKTAMLSDEVIVKDFLPDDPKMLYQYATKHFATDSEAYQYSMKRADDLLQDVSPSDHSAIVLSGDVKQKLNEPEKAVRQYELALITKPSDYKTQIVLIRLLDRLEEYDEAARRLEDLIESDFKHSEQYRTLLYEIKEKLRMKRDQSSDFSQVLIRMGHCKC